MKRARILEIRGAPSQAEPPALTQEIPAADRCARLPEHRGSMPCSLSDGAPRKPFPGAAAGALTGRPRPGCATCPPGGRRPGPPPGGGALGCPGPAGRRSSPGPARRRRRPGPSAPGQPPAPGEHPRRPAPAGPPPRRGRQPRTAPSPMDPGRPAASTASAATSLPCFSTMLATRLKAMASGAKSAAPTTWAKASSRAAGGAEVIEARGEHRLHHVRPGVVQPTVP